MNINLAQQRPIVLALVVLAAGGLVAVHHLSRNAPAGGSATPLVVAAPAPILRDTLPPALPQPDAVPLPRPRPKHKTAAKPLPPSPYPCPLVLWALRTYGQAQLDSMAREHGVSEEQKRAALACKKEPRS